MIPEKWRLGDLMATATISQRAGAVIEPVIEQILHTEISSTAATVIAAWLITLILLRAKRKERRPEDLPDGKETLMTFGFVLAMALTLL